MTKKIVAVAAVLCSLTAGAQRLHLDLLGGVANYQGDLQSKRFTFKNAGGAAGLGLTYDLTDKFSIRGAGSYLKVKGSDVSNTKALGIESRNLSFESSILEGHLLLEYNLFSLEDHTLTPYAFGGIGAFHFNPYARDSSGNKVFLRPLSTEGQGLAAYPDRKMYSNNGIMIPFGGGLKIALSDRLQLGGEIMMRKLFTDYLDDVSTTYVDSSTLAAARGPLAPAFAFRGTELHNGSVYPKDGAQRGNSGSKDWYYSLGIRISYLLGGGGNGGRSSKRSKTGCPVNVY